jgi:hypothetical protein
MTNTKVTGAICVNDVEHQVLVTTTDGTAAEVTVRDLSGGLKNIKDILRGQTMTSFWLDLATPSDLDLVQLKDKTGAIVYEFGGAINAALGVCPRCVVMGIAFRIDEGSAFEITTSD